MTTDSPCKPDTAYTYPTNTNTQVVCDMYYPDSSTASASFPLHVEVSTPTATATPDRSPDSNGWYNHPVSISFSGSAFSGIASCTPSQTYSGPAAVGAAVTGSCTDNAGKTAPASLTINYDSTPPTANLTATPADGAIDLHWSASAAPAPLGAVQITRVPQSGPTSSSVIATGASGSLHDTSVHGGIADTYTLTAVDVAGNTTTQTVTATPLTPKTRAAHHASSAPLLSWKPTRGASYYNIQLYRRLKVLSAWPRSAHFQLHRSWRFHGRRQTLSPGRYRWYAWPGFGPRSHDRYGRMIAHGTFVVR